MSKYQAYPEYTKTELGWLTEIPKHWEIKKLKYLGEALIGLTYSPNDVVDENEGTLVLRSSNVQSGQLSFKDNVFVKKQIPEHLKVKSGDILICARNGSRALIGKNALITKDAEGMSFGAFMSVFRSPYNNYLSKVFNSALFEYQSGSFLTATINQLTTSNLNSFEIPLPPKNERNLIAAFLDHETAKIDTLIEKQQQLIELLKEKRQAVISHAVTKGLNPDAPMKDSGVEWLGEVPEHWGVSSLGYYATLNTGATPDRSNMSYWNGDIPWIKTGEVKYNKIFKTEEFITDLAVKQTSVQLSPPGTLLMAMYGQGVTRGRVAILGTPATYNQACAAINPNKLLWNEYLQLFFIAGYHAIRDGGNETSQMNLNADIVRKFKVSIPPIKEQKDIVTYLESKLPSFDNLLCKAQQAINLMQERRTALISAAVTGKIDVRHFTLEDGVAPTTSNTAINEAQQEVTA